VIRRAWAALGTATLFVIGTDKALARLVSRSTAQPLPVERPSPYSPAWRRLPLDVRRRLL
jgi:hypothetical protein